MKKHKAILFAAVLFGILGSFPAMADDSPNNTEIAKLRADAEKGNVKAQFILGNAYLNGNGVPKDASEAVKWWRKAAEQNSAIAENELATAYFEGAGVPKNEAEGTKWYRKSAEQGDAWGQFFLANSYLLGAGVTKNYGEAIKWLRMSAEQGLKVSQKVLAGAYENGTGVSKDNTRAYMWWSIAGIDSKRDKIAKSMTPAQIVEAKRLADEWLRQHPNTENKSN